MKTYASSMRFEGLGSFIVAQVATGRRERMRFEFVVSEPLQGRQIQARKNQRAIGSPSGMICTGPNDIERDWMFFRLGAAAAAIVTSMMAQETALDHFEKKIRPVLASRCYACHSSAANPVQGGLRLDSAVGIRQGGNSGAVLREGDPAHSLLLRAIRHTDKNLKMPPGEPLAPEVVAEFERWIRDGAALPGSVLCGHWRNLGRRRLRKYAAANWSAMRSIDSSSAASKRSSSRHPPRPTNGR
jgi:hypothetical protein